MLKKRPIIKTLSLIAALALFPSVLIHAATMYTGDGTVSDRFEVQRWYINLTRYAPETEADRYLLVNTGPGGSPDYDICEDTAGPNDFGSTTSEWASYRITLPPLAPNARITQAAQNHSDDMNRVGFLTHSTPGGSPFYTSGVDAITRQAVEGYTNNVFGYYENLNIGARGSSGSFPSYGIHPEGVHSGLFVDVSAASRGHRQAIINPLAREIGHGTAQTNIFNWQGSGFFWTIDYDTQDFGREGSNHFFTGTLFHDANANQVYEEGEGVENIEVRLFNGSQEGASYDLTQASGSFTIPINDLPDGNTISVHLSNASGTDQTLSLPLTYAQYGTLILSNGEAQTVGFFTAPMGITNVGLRNLTPNGSFLQPSMSGPAEFQATLPTLQDVVYRVEYLNQLTSPAWQALTVVTSDQQSLTFTDPLTQTQRHYRTTILRDVYPY